MNDFTFYPQTTFTTTLATNNNDNKRQPLKLSLSKLNRHLSLEEMLLVIEIYDKNKIG
ncbi:hypothetical protein [Bartonella elizabethae]|uniref:hypothetical protein n=1 Tax=Bartonella elizabethae TaxID=807 RepID=UPI000310665B|nr:hypothetical protein [Bartonella elizabethae]